MKTLLSFLMTISCAALASAAGSYYAGSFTFPTKTDYNGNEVTPVCYQYAATESATIGKANVPLAKNEILRVCIVRDKRGSAVTETTAPAVMIDGAGQLVLGENAAGAKWLTLQWTKNLVTTEAEYIVVGDALGAPANKLYSTYYGFNVFTTEDVAGSGGKVYMYLVAMDTRTGEGICEGQPMRVKSYAMALCRWSTTQANVLPGGAGQTTPGFWWVTASSNEENADGVLVSAPGWKTAWQPAAEITSLVVDGKTLTGDDLTDYLTPKVDSMTTSAEALTLTATAPDVQYYTLYTKAKLSDESWVPFEEFVANDENLVDKINGKSYTRFRIGGESPSILQIPLISDEASRFYILRGE